MARTPTPARREIYLEAALRLFATQGVAHTTTAQIARQAGTAAGTLFLYFPTRQHLIDDLALSIGREQSQAVNAALRPAMTARQQFEAIWHASLDWLRAHPDAFAFIQQVRDAGMISPAVVEETNALFGYYYAAIQAGLREGALRPYPVELVGGLLYGAIAAVMNLHRATPDGAAKPDYARLGFELFWGGIGAG
jgi:AcrR family transcriptional regulator